MGDAGEVRNWLEERRDDVLAELIGWVRIRSVMGPAEHTIELRRSAEWLAGTLREMGFTTAEVWPTEGAPAVFAEWPAAAPDAPTVLVYSHHDVRAAKDDTWEQTPPFQPTLREGRLYGRGTSDAKGQVLAHLWGLRAWLAQGHEAPPVTLKMLVEGEEEGGSTHLAGLLDENRDRVRADLVVLSDTMLYAADAPTVCTGTRGLVQAELEVMGRSPTSTPASSPGSPPARSSSWRICSTACTTRTGGWPSRGSTTACGNLRTRSGRGCASSRGTTTPGRRAPAPARSAASAAGPPSSGCTCAPSRRCPPWPAVTSRVPLVGSSRRW
jgi:hypothetical protein